MLVFKILFKNSIVSIYMHHNGLQNTTVGEQYSWSLFKAISHMLCIGFGRFPPQNVTEVWLTIISMMVGATFYALFIGNMSTLLLSIDSSGRIYNEKVLISIPFFTLCMTAVHGSIKAILYTMITLSAHSLHVPYLYTLHR